MGFTPSLYSSFLILATLCIILPQAHAFGAGDIPDFAYLNDKAFRHGDIENILETLAKTAGHASIGGAGLLGIAASVIKAASGPSKFSKSDVKKVYFGNWLRDYSQAMDIAGLSKLSADTLVLIVSVLGFMTFGFATLEFQVTADRLGVYLPVEHIDNPKGYAEKEGDARRFHPKLRPPVQPRELEFDPNTGMKKYMATENQGWDTSTAFIRRTFRACIEAGRRANGQEGADLWEAYRLLGTGLHTMEDLLAHSNWCEIALRKLGHREVFCHVGDQVTINTPSGPAPPLVTGTFGGADFLHSLLGEAGDKLSQASVTDLSNKMNQAHGNEPNLGAVKAILSQIMGGSGSDDKLNQGAQMQAQAQGYKFNPDNVAPPEVQKQLLDLLKWHDDIMRDILKKVEMVPGLTTLLEEFSNALNAYIYTILAPYLTPILTQATEALSEGSKAVIDNEDQYEVFDNPRASDPSHSLLSKDHFGLILNEPAGKIAQILVEYSVNLIVPAWSDGSNPDQIINQILEAFHHPYYNTGRSQIQREMFDHMQRWIGGLGQDEARETIRALTKESVRNGKNKRLGSENQNYDEPGYAGCGHGGSSNKYSGGKIAVGGVYSTGTSKPSYQTEHGSSTVAGGYQTSYGKQESYGSGRQDAYGSGRQDSYGGGRQDNTGYASGRQDTSRPDKTGYGTSGGGYGGGQSGYGGGQTATGYGGGQSGYGASQTTSGYGSSQTTSGYGGGQTGYGGSQTTSGYAGQTGYGSSQAASGYGGGETTASYGGGQSGYGGGEKTAGYGGGQSGYGSGQAAAGYGGGQTGYGSGQAAAGYGSGQVTESYGGGQSGYGSGQATAGYGGRKKKDDDDDDDKRKKYGGGKYDDDNDKQKYGGGYGGGRRDDDDKPKYGGGYGGSKRDDDDKPKYGGGYGGSRRDDDNQAKYGGGGYGNKRDDDEKPKYGGGYGGKKRDDDDDKPKYGGGYGGGKRDDDDKPKYGGGGYGGGSRGDDDDKPKYGGGGYGGGGRRDDDDKPKYGGGFGGGHKRDDSDDKPKYGGHKRDDSDDKPKYGGGSQGHRRDDSDDKRKRYGGCKEDSDDEKKKKYGYGGGRDEGGYQASYGRQSHEAGYGGQGGGYGQSYGGGCGPGQSSAGYAPAYGGGRDATFGAERMKISRDSDDDDCKKGKKHGGRRDRD